MSKWQHSLVWGDLLNIEGKSGVRAAGGWPEPGRHSPASSAEGRRGLAGPGFLVEMAFMVSCHRQFSAESGSPCST